MIPSVLAQHVEQGVKDFLRTTFPVATPLFADTIEQLLNEPGNLFKGPYLDIQLPFQQSRDGADFFPDLPMPFPPYLHQEKSFARLGGPDPKSTLVATGTGSGKTECFLYPILDYCYQHRGEAGIKAIIIYPMNALATDQAGRLAKLIYGSKLRGHVTAGIYVGQREKESSMLMQPEKLISDKQTLRLSPPDILLTNYKMLDYLLIRRDDRPLWQHNNPETLRFLVVDELHTFDGAQGSDLGCLIRRLKSRLSIEPDYLCPIGTSATLGSDAEQAELLDYASALFGEKFSRDGIISESRLSVGDFLGKSLISYVDIVPRENGAELDPANFDHYEAYIKAQYRLWFDSEIQGDFADPEWRIKLGEKLKEHLFFHNLLKILAGKVSGFSQLFDDLTRVTRGLNNDDKTYKSHLLNSLIALVSEARKSDGALIRPFLNVRLQLWMRELRRMVGEVALEKSRLRFADDLNEEQLKTHLPLVHCRECGSMGWTGLKRKASSEVSGELSNFYHAFFKHDPKVIYLFPEESVEDDPEKRHYYSYLCTRCLHLTRQEGESCPFCDNPDLILVYVPDTRKQQGNRQVSVNECPYCNTTNSLTLLGSRAASLTSVMIVQLFSSSYNDDKKLLTFSDNVQDAAHRAGFFSGRTYRFNFRAALQQAILTCGDGLRLTEVADAFIKHWSAALDENKYLATFLAPNMEWFQDYEYLQKTGALPKESRLRHQVNLRIGWEIVSEYGFRARIGRTLEKTSSSIIYLDPELLQKVASRLLEPIRNEFGMFRELDENELTRFLLGLIVHLKNQGGIYQPVLKPYIDNLGGTWLINKNIWMPNFGNNSRAPVFLTTRKRTRFDLLHSGSDSRRTWYLSWLEKSFTSNPMVTAIAREFYNLVLPALVGEGIFEVWPVRSDEVWGIRPQALKISARVAQFRCRVCGHNLSVAVEESDCFNDACCQRFHCSGRYQSEKAGDDYYGKLYAGGDVERIFAKEHTGLLKRDEREELELEFKAPLKERQPWFPNLLSCTPTLEMGIDIGNLSSLILCSVPPAQTNYLQRIGRAGRRDGNALNLTVANARPHDLYFFAEPEAMLAGRIEPPGIFLDASAVLERQFTAFCFDRWIVFDESAALPKQLGQVLNNLEPVDQKKFPHSFIHYIETNQADLFDRFVGLFSSGVELSPDSVKNLKLFVEGDRDWQGSLRYRIMNGLHNRNLERESLRKKVRTLNGKIKTKKNGPKDKNFDKELRELGIEKSALQTLVKNITDRNVFNFFTDEGLLPNYAFPEVGVMLNSLIYRKKQTVQEGESSYDTWTYEYERPAVSAIAELAPANTFYAGGRKVEVDKVDMVVSEVETWRFCNNCSHKELLGSGNERELCSKCGSPMWADAGQKRLMLKMRQVFASTPDRKSRISDDSDDRDPLFFNKQMLVEFDETNIMDAYKVDADYPFGFDFLEKVDFCEINFGEKTEIGEKVTIAGVEAPRKGFAVCRVCGKVQNEKEPAHDFSCTARDKDSDKNLIDCLYLYRQFTSEAIRILLPVSIISGADRKLQSFIAAIQLGLKRKFKGKIDHLQTMVHEEPLPDSSFKRKYLVLYDTVPGGTGYLKQLMRSETQLMEVLELALESLKSCVCNQEEDKDGCYRCLFAYRSSYNMPETSRDTAIDLLAEILSFRENLVKTDSLKNISLNTFIESELEARFIGALKNLRSEEVPIMLTQDLVNGKPGYFLKVAEKAYYIEPQVELGELDGVTVPSRADFVIRAARMHDRMKPVVVFLDGYTYHRDRIGRDTAQRMAIVQSGNFHVWSLSWHDVECKFKTLNNFYRDYLDPSALLFGTKFNELLGHYGLSDWRKIHEKNSFDLLIYFLQYPETEKWQKYAFVHSLLHMDPNRFNNPEVVDRWRGGVTAQLPEEIAELINGTDGPCRYGLFEPIADDGSVELKQYVVFGQESKTPPNGVCIGCCLPDDADTRQKDEFQPVWNGFLRLFNYLQFLPAAFFVSSEGLKHYYYDSIKLLADKVKVGLGEQVPTDGQASYQAEWDEVEELTDNTLHSLLYRLKESGWPVPEAGYELAGADGEVVASAELAWEGLKIAFLINDELTCLCQFEDEKWQAYPMREVLENPEKYISLHSKQEG
ncbi:MAG: DEAD/DEAH box helicase [Pseudomonadota bacterium]|nr:DEAD/DEAH box helicase [Pseudomonadota bacterium]